MIRSMNGVANGLARLSLLMDRSHDWEDTSDPERTEGRLIVSRVSMRCSRCGLEAGVLPIRPEDEDCEVVLVRSVLES